MIEKQKIAEFSLLMSEWDYEKNSGLDPDKISAWSHKKVWWKCLHGHSWEATVSNRANRNSGCPFCAGHRAWAGFNDLATVNPQLAEEWNYAKNGELLPTMLTARSNVKVWWKCKHGHEWEATIDGRSKNSCPYCSNHKILEGFNDFATTEPSLLLEWDYEKNQDISPQKVSSGSSKYVWWKCKQGHSWRAVVYARTRLGSGCPYCAGKKVVMGVNDLESQRPEVAAEWDYQKNEPLVPSQFSVGSSERVWWKCSKGHFWQAQIISRAIDNTGCPYCCGHDVWQGDNDLASANPELTKEWNYEKNFDITPVQISAGSHKKVWWKCMKGHEWEAVIKDRAQGRGCPYCSGRRVKKGENDLATTHPQLAAEWDYEKNKSILPEEISAGSGKSIWWRCEKEHSWQAHVGNRVRGDGCPYCSGKRVLTGFNDIVTTHPELAAEWDYERNDEIKPTQVSFGCVTKVWWKCRNGHSWQAKINSRTANNIGCPYCWGRYAWPGESDLATLNPTLAKEWNYEKNLNITPQQITIGSNKKVWWKCKLGHEWQASVKSRSSAENNCPVCFKKYQTSFPEQTLYYYLQKAFPDAVNRYAPEYLCGMELDIYLPSQKIGIEYDGRQWHSNRNVKKRELRKYALCKEQGIKLVRFREAIEDECADTCDVWIALDYDMSSLKEAIIELLDKLHVHIDINIDRDRFEILERFYTEYDEVYPMSRTILNFRG